MPILNKLEYLDETKQQIKNALNTKFNSQITDKDTFRSYVEKIKNIYTNWPKIPGEGTSLKLTNTKKGRLGLEPNGDLSQETTTGKNIIDYENLQPIYTSASTYSIINNGIRITANSAGTYRVIGFNLGETANLIGKVLRFKCDFVASGQNIGAYGLGYCDANGENRLRKAYTSTSGTAIQMTVDNTNTNIYLLLYENVEGSSSANDYVDFTNIIGTVDNEDMSYELYTGNQPSPSPNYPQVIKVVTGDQNIKIHGKNFFDKNYYIEHKTDFINVYEGFFYALELNDEFKTQFTASISTNGTNLTNYILAITDSLGSSPSNSSRLLNLDGTIKNITFDFTNSKHVYLQVGGSVQGTGREQGLELILNNYNIQIEQGTIATTYEQYQSQTYPLSLGSLELAKIGNYKDYIYRENGKWYKYKIIGKKIFNGSETFSYNNASVWNIRYAEPTMMRNDTTVTTYNFFSNYYKAQPGSTNNYAIGQLSTEKLMCFKNIDITSAVAFKQWVSTHNLIVYYILETPTTTEITDTTLIKQLDNLYNANSYDDTTIIFSDGDLPVVMNASALMKGGA